MARFFASAYPARTASMAALLLVAGLAEGLGIVTLLPVLDLAISGSDREGAGGLVLRGLADMGLPATLATLLVILVGLFLAKALATMLAHRQAAFIVARVAMELRVELLRVLLKAEWRHFTSYPTGYLANAVSNEAHRTASAYHHFVRIVARLILAGIYGVIVVLISWQTAVVALLTGLGVLWVLRGMVHETASAGRDQMLLMRSLIARMTDTLPGLKAIKAMAREAYVLPLLEEEADGFRVAQQRAATASAWILTMHEPLVVGVLALGLWGVLTYTSLPFAEVLILAALFYRLTTSITEVQRGQAIVAEGEASFHSLQEHIVAAERSAEGWTGTAPAPRIDFGIVLDDLSFAYDGTPVLESVDLEILQGQMVVLTGASGGGKTTLCDQLTGLLRPCAGRVVVDGIDLADIDLSAWRGRIGYVPQEPLLFNDSIRMNLTLGAKDIPDETVERALVDAGAWDFVKALPDGLDHGVGERGGLLSGGQRQRIALARALVGSPRLLILDEPTSALDAASESAICRTLQSLKGKITVLAISHRPAIRDMADRVVELRNGALVT